MTPPPRLGPRWWPLWAILFLSCTPAPAPPPPPPPGARPDTGGGGPGPNGSSSAVIGLVLPAAETIETSLIGTVASQEAGVQRVVLESRRPRPDAPASAQAQLVRDLARDGCGAIIVLVHEEAGDLAAAIDEVQKMGTRIVLLGGPLETQSRVHRVDTVDYQKAAAALVAAMIADAKAGELATDPAPILLVREQAPDSHTQRRIAALTAALAEAGRDPVRVTFEKTEADAANALEQALATHDKTTLVFAEGDFGVIGAEGVRTVWGQKLQPDSVFPFLVGGFLTAPQYLSMVKRGNIAAVIDWNLPGIAREAVRRALALARGQDVPERTELPTPLVQPPVPSSSIRTMPTPATAPPRGRD